MNAFDTAKATAQAIGEIPSNFMIDPNTYKRGTELGFSGFDFYVAGRGGALGEVPGSVVAASFFFFKPTMIVNSWNASAKVMDRRSAGNEFAKCAHLWAESHLSGDVDFLRLAKLLGQVNTQVNPAGSPLFAGWLSLDVPTSPKGQAIHQLNALRELRGSYHQAAILVNGIGPHQAVAIKTPYMLGIYGWDGPEIEEESKHLPVTKWEQAEQATHEMTARALSLLDDSEQSELISLLGAIEII